MNFSTKVSILAISLGIFSVGIVFAVISNSDESKIRELISTYQTALNNEEIEKISTLYSDQAIDFIADETENSMKFFDNSINAFVQFNTNQIESWFATFKKAKN